METGKGTGQEKEVEADLEKDSILDNRYVIIRKIGSGGFAKTYLVLDQKDENEYAAKIVLEKRYQKDKRILLNEINIINKLNEIPENNKYLIQYHGSGVGKVRKNQVISKDREYLITNYISKGNLIKYIMKTEEGFEEKHAKIIFYRILKSVQFIHNYYIICL